MYHDIQFSMWLRRHVSISVYVVQLHCIYMCVRVLGVCGSDVHYSVNYSLVQVTENQRTKLCVRAQYVYVYVHVC